MRPLTALVLSLLTAATPVFSQERSAIGSGRLFTNDFFGDGHDRWRTGSYVYSHVRAPTAYKGRVQSFGEIIEYRFRSELISASRNDTDRLYVGALSVGAYTHFESEGLQASLGVSVTAVGPQTQLSQLQAEFHEAFDMPVVSTDNQISDAFSFGGALSITHTYQLHDRVTVRPFSEVLVGPEDLLRVGGDVVIGDVGQSDLMLRDEATGHLYRGTNRGESGFSFVFGADFAAVANSEYLPEDQGFVASGTRARARAGLHFQMEEDVDFFYGMTYLSEEFVGQEEGQFVGSLKLNFNF